MAAKSQGIGQYHVHIRLDAFLRYIVEIALLIGDLQACCRVDKSILNGLNAGDKFHSARRAQEMSNHRLCGADGHMVSRIT